MAHRPISAALRKDLGPPWLILLLPAVGIIVLLLAAPAFRDLASAMFDLVSRGHFPVLEKKSLSEEIDSGIGSVMHIAEAIVLLIFLTALYAYPITLWFRPLSGRLTVYRRSRGKYNPLKEGEPDTESEAKAPAMETLAWVPRHALVSRALRALRTNQQIVLEGPFGSGKSALCRDIERVLRVIAPGLAHVHISWPLLTEADDSSVCQMARELIVKLRSALPDRSVVDIGAIADADQLFELIAELVEDAGWLGVMLYVHGFEAANLRLDAIERAAEFLRLVGSNARFGVVLTTRAPLKPQTCSYGFRPTVLKVRDFGIRETIQHFVNLRETALQDRGSRSLGLSVLRFFVTAPLGLIFTVTAGLIATLLFSLVSGGKGHSAVVWARIIDVIKSSFPWAQGFIGSGSFGEKLGLALAASAAVFLLILLGAQFLLYVAVPWFPALVSRRVMNACRNPATAFYIANLFRRRLDEAGTRAKAGDTLRDTLLEFSKHLQESALQSTRVHAAHFTERAKRRLGMSIAGRLLIASLTDREMRNLNSALQKGPVKSSDYTQRYDELGLARTFFRSPLEVELNGRDGWPVGLAYPRAFREASRGQLRFPPRVPSSEDLSKKQPRLYLVALAEETGLDDELQSFFEGNARNSVLQAASALARKTDASDDMARLLRLAECCYEDFYYWELADSILEGLISGRLPKDPSSFDDQRRKILIYALQLRAALTYDWKGQLGSCLLYLDQAEDLRPRGREAACVALNEALLWMQRGGYGQSKQSLDRAVTELTGCDEGPTEDLDAIRLANSRLSAVQSGRWTSFGAIQTPVADAYAQVEERYWNLRSATRLGAQGSKQTNEAPTPDKDCEEENIVTDPWLEKHAAVALEMVQAWDLVHSDEDLADTKLRRLERAIKRMSEDFSMFYDDDISAICTEYQGLVVRYWADVRDPGRQPEDAVSAAFARFREGVYRILPVHFRFPVLLRAIRVFNTLVALPSRATGARPAFQFIPLWNAYIGENLLEIFEMEDPGSSDSIPRRYRNVIRSLNGLATLVGPPQNRTRLVNKLTIAYNPPIVTPAFIMFVPIPNKEPLLLRPESKITNT